MLIFIKKERDYAEDVEHLIKGRRARTVRGRKGLVDGQNVASAKIHVWMHGRVALC